MKNLSYVLILKVSLYLTSCQGTLLHEPLGMAKGGGGGAKGGGGSRSTNTTHSSFNNTRAAGTRQTTVTRTSSAGSKTITSTRTTHSVGKADGTQRSYKGVERVTHTRGVATAPAEAKSSIARERSSGGGFRTTHTVKSSYTSNPAAGTTHSRVEHFETKRVDR